MAVFVSEEDREVTIEYLNLQLTHPAKAIAFYKMNQEAIDRVYQWHFETVDEWKREKVRAIYSL